MMIEPTRKHKHRNCKRLLGSLSEYVDGELDEKLCTDLEQHLDECEDCRIVVDTLRKTVSLYRTTAKNEVITPDIRQRLFRSLNIEDYLEK